jgi:predicted small lipoprotein YifL
VIRRLPVLSYRLAVVAVLAAALGVSACGRRGALDAPPGGLAANPAGSLDEETDEGGEVVRRGSARGLPIIRGPDRRIPLDVLLD